MANIKWRPQDIDELRKEIERYNRKVKRLAKKGFESDLFPVSKPFKEIQKDITTRGEYKDYLAHLRNLTEKGSEYKYTPASEKGVTISKGEVKELDRMIKIINSDRRKRIKEYQERTGANVKNLPEHDIQQYTLQLKPTVDKQLKKANYGGSMNRMNFQKFIESVQIQSDKDYIEERYDRFLETYIEHLPRHLSEEQTYDIVNRLGNINAKDFYYLSLEYPELTVEFLYDPLTVQEKYEQITSVLDTVGFESFDVGTDYR